jgi:hypothetical protein
VFLGVFQISLLFFEIELKMYWQKMVFRIFGIGGQGNFETKTCGNRFPQENSQYEVKRRFRAELERIERFFPMIF